MKRKTKNKAYDTDGTIPKSNIKIAEGGQIETINTEIHDRSLSWLYTCISSNLAKFYEVFPMQFVFE